MPKKTGTKRRTKKTYKRKAYKPRIKRGVKSSYNGYLKIKRYANSIYADGWKLGTLGGPNGLTENATSDGLMFTTSATTGAITFGSWAFYAMLNDVTNENEFTNLYDRYIIDRVKLTFIPYSTQANAGAAQTVNMPQAALMLHHVLDYNDATPPSNSSNGLDVLRQYPSYKCVNLMNLRKGRYSISFKPRVSTAVSVNSPTTNVNSKSEAFTWMDCASGDVAGYGVKGIFENISPGTSGFYHYLRCELTYYLRFRDPK